MDFFSIFHRWNRLVLALLLVSSMVGCRVWNRTHVTSANTIASRQFVQQAAESLEQQQMENAEAQLTLAVRSNPENVEARFMLGETLWKQGKKEEALREMERVAVNSEVSAQQVNRLAEMYFELGNIEKAQKNVSLALKYDSTLAKAWFLQGKIFEFMHQNDEALTAYHQAAFYTQDASKIHAAIAQLYLKTGKPQRALEITRSLRMRNSAESPSVEMLLCESKALTELNRTADAVQLLTEARQKNPESSEIQTALAQILEIQPPSVVTPMTRIGTEVQIPPKGGIRP